MTALGAARAARRAADLLMVDTCTIHAEVPPVYDADTDTYVLPASALHYAGPCRVKPQDNADRVVAAAEQSVSLWPYIVTVPLTATGIELDDLITITAAGADPDLVDLVLRVRNVPRGSLLSARRLGCEVQSA